MTARPRIVATRRLPSAVEAALAEAFEFERSREDRPQDANGMQRLLARADGLIVTIGDRVTAEVLATNPRRTRILANFGAGTDHIDLDAARAYGIAVTNTPDAVTIDTADLTLALILATLRRAGEGEREVRSGQWTGWRPTHLLGRRVTGRTLGIIGLGRIGRAVARRATRGFDMRVIGTSRSRPADALLEEGGIEWRESIDAICAESDIVTLHVPGGVETRDLLNARRIALMRPGTVLINTARGGVVNSDAMIAALQSGHLGGVGLDVYPQEPEVDLRLCGLERAVLLPHLGTATSEARDEMGFSLLDDLTAFFRDGSPCHRVA